MQSSSKIRWQNIQNIWEKNSFPFKAIAFIIIAIVSAVISIIRHGNITNLLGYGLAIGFALLIITILDNWYAKYRVKRELVAQQKAFRVTVGQIMQTLDTTQINILLLLLRKKTFREIGQRIGQSETTVRRNWVRIRKITGEIIIKE